MNQTSDKSWLVRSSGVILGPFSMEEMISALQERRIAIIDEVRSSTSRWSFIREHPQFASVVQFLREQQAQAKEDTGATFIGTKTATASQKTITQTNTEKIEQAVKAAKAADEIKPDAIKTALPSVNGKPIQYGSAADPKLQKRIRVQSQRSSSMAWILLFGLIAFGILYFNENPVQFSREKSLSYEDYLRLAKSNRATGNYERALEFMKKADALSNMELSGQLIIAPMMMMVENQNIQARRKLEEALKNYKAEDRDKLEAESLIALSYLREGQLDEAEKLYQALLVKSPDYEPAQINILEISILKGDFDSAYHNLTKMMKEKIKDPVLILYRALVTYRVFETDKGKEKLTQSVDDLKRFRQKSYDYFPETLLIQAALQRKMGAAGEVKATLRELISTYPDITKEHLHNYLIHKEILGWKYLNNICEILIESGEKESMETQGLQAYCDYEQGDLKTAMEQIDKAGAQYSKESLLFGLRSFLLMRSGRLNEAKSIFSLPNTKESLLTGIMEGQMCEKEKNDTCAENAWKSVIGKNEGEIMGLAGLARLSLNKGNKENTADYVMRAMLKSNNYKPILEIKDQLDQR